MHGALSGHRSVRYGSPGGLVCSPYEDSIEKPAAQFQECNVLITCNKPAYEGSQVLREYNRCGVGNKKSASPDQECDVLITCNDPAFEGSQPDVHAHVHHLKK